jgi:transposase-like protein
MTSKPKTTQNKNNTTTNSNPPKKKATRKRAARRRQPSRQFSAEQKAQAVLAAWTEKLNQSEICRQLQINYVTFQNWQKRAMEGMLQALEDHARLSDGAALSPRLRKLMESQRGAPSPNLEERLKQIQLAPQQERDKSPSV